MILLKPRCTLSDSALMRLQQSMIAYYKAPVASYYSTAATLNSHYDAREMPFHCDLLTFADAGTSVLEMGCGTAHLCRETELKGGHYTGLDFSEELLAANRQRFPKARFLQVDAPLNETFDLVASLYAIEHVPDPPVYLSKMWARCKPGGVIAVICPEFVDCPSLPPSLFYGTTPRRFREKCYRLDLADALRHLLDLKFLGPVWKRKLIRSMPGSFWINLRPKALYNTIYSIDADAVHLSRLKDLVWFFQTKGARILKTSTSMPDVSPEILKYNCYLAVQKPR
jgi:SAM-dependent methyltransferase